MLAVLLPSGRCEIACSRRLRGEAPIERRLLFRCVARHVERARHADLDGMEVEPVGLHRRRDRTRTRSPVSIQRGELVEQQIVPALRHAADRFRMAGALPERRMRLLDGRRLDDDVVELPVFAVET